MFMHRFAGFYCVDSKRLLVTLTHFAIKLQLEIVHAAFENIQISSLHLGLLHKFKYSSSHMTYLLYSNVKVETVFNIVATKSLKIT